MKICLLVPILSVALTVVLTATFTTAICSTVSQANGFLGSIQFSAAEQTQHLLGLRKVLDGANGCMSRDLNHHNEFFARWGISPFYGDRSSFSRLSDSDKRKELKKRKLPTYLLDELRPTSCVGIALKCLEVGFEIAQQQALWRKISDYTSLNDSDGTALQDALQSLGWKILFWAPVPRFHAQIDAGEQRDDPTNRKAFWGYHVYRTTTVQENSLYLYNKVDDGSTLFGFEKTVPSKFLQVPFWIGTAHGGYHVFPGTYGQVIEGHSTRSIDDPNTIESEEFNPNKVGAGPRGQYFSGIIAVPPGYGF